VNKEKSLQGAIQNLYLWLKSRHLGQSAIDTRYALAEACIIGILSGIAALFLKQGIGWVGGLRLELANHFGAGYILPAAGLLLGMLAGWLIENLSPAAAGGGIPQVKAVLGGFPLACSLRVAIVKALGTILILGAGFPLGRRGPTVHIGAALAAQLSTWLPTSPQHRRQMIAAGAAAGLAASFNTPIAGVMFVVEELMRDISGLTLETAILASFTGAVVSRILGSTDLGIQNNLIAKVSSFTTPEIPFYLLLGIIAGTLGSFFNYLVLFFLKTHRKLKFPLYWRIGLTGLISGSIVALLPQFFQNNAGLRDFLFSGESSWQNIAIAFFLHLFLTPLAYASSAPGGIFAPGLVLGAALGYLVGNLEVFLLGNSSVFTYTLAGMSAFFTAVVRVPITAIIIVFEITADFNAVLPLMIGSAVSYVVAESIFPGSLYEHLLKASGINLKEDNSNSGNLLTTLKAADVMQSQVESLSVDLSFDGLLKAMSQSNHRGFPITDEGKLVGIVTQSDLNKKKSSLREIMSSNPITINPNASLGDVLYLLNRYHLSRIPVTEGNKLVGIITRTDIIRAEAKELSGVKSEKPKPSYVLYQTHSPALGKGRILLPIANPDTAKPLLIIASAIARYYNYELDCLHIVEVPKHQNPSEAKVNYSQSRKMMQRLQRLGNHLEINLHTHILAANDTVDAILEFINVRHIKTVLMGWRGINTTGDAIFGNIVDKLISKVPGDLLLVKLGGKDWDYGKQYNKWLIPIAGGPNSKKALELLPALASLSEVADSPQIILCQVHSPSEEETEYSELIEARELLEKNLALPIVSIPLCSISVANAVIDLATVEQCNLVLLGVTREGLLKQVISGNIPETIARSLDTTVILFRCAK
jgi:CIC family chloride channel protein